MKYYCGIKKIIQKLCWNIYRADKEVKKFTLVIFPIIDFFNGRKNPTPG